MSHQLTVIWRRGDTQFHIGMITSVLRWRRIDHRYETICGMEAQQDHLADFKEPGTWYGGGMSSQYRRPPTPCPDCVAAAQFALANLGMEVPDFDA